MARHIHRTTLGLLICSLAAVIAPATMNATLQTDRPVITASNADQVTQEAVLQGNTDWMLDMAFSPDGNLLAVAETGNPYLDFEHINGTVRLWDVNSLQESQILQSPDYSVMSLDFSSDGQQIATGGTDGDVWIWDVETGEVISVLDGEPIWVNSVAFSPDNRTIASTHGFPYVLDGDFNIQIQVVATGQTTLLYTSSSQSAAPTTVTFYPDGTLIAVGMADGSSRLWDTITHEMVDLFGTSGWTTDVIFNAKGTLIASTTGSISDHMISIWNVDTRMGQVEVEINRTLSLSTEHQIALAIDFSPEGTLLAAGYLDGIIGLWDVDSGEEIVALEGHTDRVVSIAFSPDGTLLASGGIDGKVRLWSVPQ